MRLKLVVAAAIITLIPLWLGCSASPAASPIPTQPQNTPTPTVAAATAVSTPLPTATSIPPATTPISPTPTHIPPTPTNTPAPEEAEVELAIALIMELEEAVTNSPAHKAAEADLLECMNTPHDDGYGELKAFSSLDHILQNYTEPVYTKMEEGGVCSAQTDAMFDTIENLSRTKLAELRRANPEYNTLLSTEHGKEFAEGIGDRNIIMLYAKLSAPMHPTPASPTPTTTPTATSTPPPTATATPSPHPDPTISLPTLTIGEVTFKAEVADTSSLRSKGLGQRDSLEEQTGMLFIFPSGNTSSFWMKGMRFPLDFVWIGADCTVVDLTQDVQHFPPDTPDSKLDILASSHPAAYTFEINAGEVSRFGIEIGDTVRFQDIDSEFAQCCESGVCDGN